MQVDVKFIDEETNTIGFVFSTSDVDRHGEQIAPGSWLLDEYRKNPVVLFAHDDQQPAIGQVTRMEYDADGTLTGDIQFAASEYEFAGTLFRLYKGKYMRAVSVGFMSDDVDISDGKAVLKRNTLYEISVVNVPANAAALAKAKGINVPDKLINSTKDEVIPDESVEAIEAVRDSLQELLENVGDVLSEENVEIIENARDMLGEVLDEAEPAEPGAQGDSKAGDTNKSGGRKQPVIKDGTAHAVSTMNRAIRSLIKAKSDIKT
jgi:uncharacterized protein